MAWPFRKSRDRYYLLAGMGGRMARKKGRWAMKIGLIIGFLAALILAAIILVANKP